MGRILIGFLFLAFSLAPGSAQTAQPLNETEVRAQAIIGLLIQQRDEAMNQVAALAVELAKAKARIEAQKQEPKK